MIAIIVFVSVFSTAFFWKPPQGYDVPNEQSYWSYPLNTTYFGESDVIWSAGEATKYPQNQIQVIDGSSKISNISKKTSLHVFDVDATSETRLVDNTTYFPGWRVYDGRTKLPVEFQDINWRGLITFHVGPGKHHIRVVFEESPTRGFADIVSITSFSALALYIVTKKFLKV